MRYEIRLAAAAALAGLGACAGLQRSPGSSPYRLSVLNETPAALAVEYCTVACIPLGELKSSERKVFAVPGAAVEESDPYVQVVGKEYFAGGAFRQWASAPVYLRRGTPAEVVLRPRAAASAAPGTSR
jgi:hypothetical protein